MHPPLPRAKLAPMGRTRFAPPVARPRCRLRAIPAKRRALPARPLRVRPRGAPLSLLHAPWPAAQPPAVARVRRRAVRRALPPARARVPARAGVRAPSRPVRPPARAFAAEARRRVLAPAQTPGASRCPPAEAPAVLPPPAAAGVQPRARTWLMGRREGHSGLEPARGSPAYPPLMRPDFRGRVRSALRRRHPRRAGLGAHTARNRAAGRRAGRATRLQRRPAVRLAMKQSSRTVAPTGRSRNVRCARSWRRPEGRGRSFGRAAHSRPSQSTPPGRASGVPRPGNARDADGRSPDSRVVGPTRLPGS